MPMEFIKRLASGLDELTELDILMMYLPTKNEHSRPKQWNLEYEQDTQTDATEDITMLHSSVLATKMSTS